jgi:hypothetical protein
VAHGEHAQPAQLLRRVEHHGGEPAHNHTHTTSITWGSCGTRYRILFLETKLYHKERNPDINI